MAIVELDRHWLHDGPRDSAYIEALSPKHPNFNKFKINEQHAYSNEKRVIRDQPCTITNSRYEMFEQSNHLEPE